MGFDTRNGTRGARQPNGRLMRLMNRVMTGRIRRKGGNAMGMNVLVLVTVGRKSGVERETPVGWFPGPDGSWLIVASAAGAAGNPAWYYNLAAHPDRVRVEIGSQSVPVIAEQLSGTERDEAWRQITTKAPRFSEYQTKTDRELPIIRLTPSEEGTS
ncbi:deazaflavin-dependent oxidoreductase (nitroreductase family) [Actinoplanes lutulentus]|uniref:Deazaflavin-dependent oxidoreductase (Nitroreductase family) n=1 Tax=Actinoplanes lutulentus TaxID=1287878 RepID=A0A327Z1L8_9ACTN|nr:nitroreductase family deazaflavin-dependent oxidoreductase [Actinoplanes lutulentus]MBB2943372.1 deazaflavin-dependent oxidoreductase (nitroreductase family) [Actinoplanes lutulentus]RAK28430.1 deazaflavin-dependent oxidoreductase (nitroreductase family) [Actinoplanes lutulentus]